MANVTVVSYHNGGVPQEISGPSPAGIAQDMGLSLDGVTIHVDSNAAEANQELRDGDLVSFQKDKVKSGV